MADTIMEKLHSYNVYEDGNRLVGMMDEIDLPGFDFLSDTLSGTGIAGEMDDPTMGLTKSIEWEPKFKTLTEEIDLDPTKSKTYTIRGAQQGRDSAGNVVYKPIKATVQGRPKSFTGGKLKQGGSIEPSKKMEVTYYKLEVGDKVLFEIDKLNSVCIINGHDILAEVKKYC
jgi:P2 family phage contractile tail tube protein